MKIQELALQAIQDGCGDLTGKRVLEIGAGNGFLSGLLAQAGARVTALDLEDLRHQNLANGQLEAFVRHDLSSGTLPFADASFDAVSCTEVLEHLRAPFLILSEMVRVLRMHGTLVLSLPNYWNIRYRLKYVFTGSFQRPIIDEEQKKESYFFGYAPHLNSIPYPTLKSILSWEGCGDFDLRARATYGWGSRLLWSPLSLSVRLYTALHGPARRRRYLLDETNGKVALFGQRQILIKCRRIEETPKRTIRDGAQSAPEGLRQARAADR